MKTKLTAFILGLALSALVRASAPVPATAPCCVPVAPKPACCAEEIPAAPLSTRSLYQLEATWTNDAGASVQLAALRGRPVVLAMFFAQCGYACPVLVRDMQRLREHLPVEVRARAQFVLVSFDVSRDTVAALKSYRENAGLDEAWTLSRAAMSRRCRSWRCCSA